MSKSNKILFTLICVFGLILISVFALRKDLLNENENVLAQINDLTVTTTHFENAFKEYYYRTGQVLSPDISTRKAILDTEFNTYVLAVHAMDLDIDKSESSFQKKEAITRRVITEEYLNQVILADILVEEKELQEYFLRFNTQLRASHLFARTKLEIDELYKRLGEGENFDDLAKETFGNSYMAENGGDIGRFTTDELDVSFEEKVFNMEVGEVSEPVQTAQGYSIIKLTERVSKPILTEYEYNQKRDQLYSYVLKKKKELKTRSHLKDFVDNVALDDVIVTTLWESISKNIESMASKNIEFYSDLNSKNELASYKDFSFTVQDFRNEYLATSSNMLRSIYNEKTFRDFIKGVSYRAMILEKAYSLNISNQDLVKESISETYYHFLADEVNRRLLEEIQNTEAELFNSYQENQAKFIKPLDINFVRIVLSSEKEAKSVLEMAKKGEDFSNLVKKYTISNEDRLTEGELGFKSIKSYGFLEMQLSKLGINEISDVIQYQENEFHIYKCVGRDEAQPLTFAQARNQVNDFLTKKKLVVMRASTLEEVKKKHNAIIDLEKLSELTIKI